jgi:cobalt-precorrin-5B (C1)-methyltransferase
LAIVKKEPKDKSKLRTGFTTGACSTAAVKAACEMLVSGEDRSQISVKLPMGKTVRFALERHERSADGSVTCSVIKDAGDDPDCTDGAHLTATVRPNKQRGLLLKGGEGVGTITKPGLGLDVGSAAINPVPRECITEAVTQSGLLDQHPGVEVIISVPGGEEMATHTLNERLGIVGGISILGTTGIVRPYSTSAFKASVEQAIGVAASLGIDHVVLTTGGRSEKYAKAQLPNLPEAAFVQMGDFVGFALQSAVKHHITKVSLVGMIGKLSKLADGRRQTHASGSQVNMDLLARLTRATGAPKEVVDAVREANTGRHAMELVDDAGYPGLGSQICQKAHHYASRFADGPLEIQVIITDFEGNVLGRHP